jgi:hypothetical protein
VQLGFLKGHPKSIAGSCTLSAELEQKKQMLQRDKAGTMPPSWQSQSRTGVAIVRNNRLEQPVTIGGRHPKL